MYKIVSLDDVKAAINPELYLAFDTETIGFYGEIRLAQFYQKGWSHVLIVDRPNIYMFLGFMVEIQDVTIAMQVSAYDISTVQQQSGSRFIPKNFLDTFYLARLAYPHLESFALDAILDVVLGFDPYKQNRIDKSKMQKSNWKSLILTDEQFMYASIDVFYLPEVIDKVVGFLEDMNYKLDMLVTRKALDFQNNGFPVIKSVLEKQYAANQVEIAKIALPINCNSYIQVRKYIDSDESDGLGLATLGLQGNARATAVLKTRRLTKQLSFMDKYNTEDGMIYGKFAPLARSGRFTCKDDNLQQNPRLLKHLFGYEPDEGKVLIYGDYPQLELRTIAAITDEKILIKLFKEGKDPHNHVAAGIFSADFTPEERQITKTYNFNLLYLGGASMVQGILIEDCDMYRDLDQIRTDIRKWKRQWPAITSWQEEVIRSHRRGSLRSTPMGRRYKGKIITDHANIENSGFGAEIAKLAMHYMYDDIKETGAVMANFVHDAYILTADYDPPANIKAAQIMKDAMQEAWYEGCKLVTVKDIPMPAQVFCGYNIKTIEKDYLFKL